MNSTENGLSCEFEFSNEPREDFSAFETRKKMDEALDWFLSKSSFETEYPIIINGEEFRFMDGSFLSFDPAIRGLPIGRVYTANSSIVAYACKMAEKNYYENFGRPVEERIVVVGNILRLMREEKYRLAAIMVFESSKSQEGALAEVEEAIDFAEMYSQHATEILKSVFFQPSLKTESNVLHKVPRGPTVVISPWNFPLSLLFGRFIDSYLAGCPVLAKPAEQSSIIAWYVVDMMLRAGMDKGAIAFLPGYGDIGEKLVMNPSVANICFTGSRAVGFLVTRTAASFPGNFGQKRVDLELGGINSIIVTPSADPDESIKGVISSKFGQQGQKCSALQRLFLVGDRELWQDWLLRLSEAVDSLEFGHPADKIRRYKYNAVIDGDAYRRLQDNIITAKGIGKCVHQTRYSVTYNDGYFVSSAIFTDVPHDHPIVAEEIFGPILFVFFAESLDVAIDMAGVYPHITSGIYSLLESEIDQFVSGMMRRGSGNIYVNRAITGSMVGRNPFGGRRKSGSGLKTGIPERLNFFLDEVTVTRNYLSQGILVRDKKD